jgi:replication factor C subunit 3/5
MNAYLPWVEKYRPKTIDDIISHDQNIKTIKQLLINKSLPHLLFHGSPGTGKTSTIMALAKEIYGDNIVFMVMKLDASDDRGINSVREDIKGFAEKSNMFYSGVKLIILDEVDAMTFDAQFALRRIIEKFSATIRFCLICNYENKIISAIRSRCANFRFSNINVSHISNKLNHIINNENIKHEEGIVNIIATIARGDLRKAINILQTISMQSKYITKDMCYNTTNIPTHDTILSIINILIDNNITFNEAYSYINNIFKTYGYSLYTILKEVTILLLNTNCKNIIKIISELSILENLVTYSTFDDIYISAFVSIFKKTS